MSWSNVRSSMITTIEALTPSTTTIGEPLYRHVSDEQMPDASRDRLFAVTLTAPPAHLGVTTITGRWVSSVDVVVWYERTRYYTDDQDRIAEDSQQIQTALLDYGNLSTDTVGIIASSDQYVQTKLVEDNDGYTLVLSLTVQHL